MHSDRDRIAADPALAAALRAGYRGSGDALDQLHWLDHPGEAGPSGAPDPALVLRALREQAFRPDPVPGAAEAAAGLEARIRLDRAAAADAADALEIGAVPATQAAAEPAQPASEPAAPAPTGRSGAPAPKRGSRLRALVVAVPAAAVLGLVAGVLLGPRVGGAGQPATAPHALVVFDRAARVADRPVDASLPDFIRGARVRLLQIYPSIGMVAYGARTADGRICLLTVILGTRSSAACVSEQAFADSGVSAVLLAEEDPAEGATRPSQDEIDLRWSPTGWISITPVPVTAPSPSASASQSGLTAS